MFHKLTPALLAPLLVAASCATESHDAAIEVRTGSAAAVALRSAPDAVAETGTAAFEMVMEMSLAGKTSELVATGAYDTDHQRMSMEMDMGAMFEQMAGSTGETLPDGYDEPMQIVADGATVYLRMPLLEAIGAPSGWLSMSSDDLGGAGADLGLGSYDPSKLLETLRGVTGEPEVVGTEEVRGVETTRYTATMDLAKAIEAAPTEQRDLLEGQLDQLGAAEIPVDVWVDADGLPRRMRMDMGGMFNALGGGDTGGAVMTMEFFDYGKPVDIQVPPPDEVSSFTDVLGGLGDLGGSLGTPS